MHLYALYFQMNPQIESLHSVAMGNQNLLSLFRYFSLYILLTGIKAFPLTFHMQPVTVALYCWQVERWQIKRPPQSQLKEVLNLLLS